MKWQELSRAESEKLFGEFCICEEEKREWDKCPPEYMSLKNDLERLMQTVLFQLGIDREDIGKKGGRNAYLVDLYFGLDFYRLMNEKYGMTPRLAATEGIWRYISLIVAPDLIEMRYSTDHPDRYWKNPRRLWFYVIWWYIHLSWQGNQNATLRILRNNTTDEILQLVDRCGKGGYRVEMTRELMRKCSEFTAKDRKDQMFRHMMVLSTARLQVMEPSLVEGGEAGYIAGLYNYFAEK